MNGTWSDKKGDQFWHIAETNGVFVGVGTWNGYEHWDCILRGFKKPNGDITMAINYSFRKKEEQWASNHIAYWKGKQVGERLTLQSKQSQQKLELERKRTSEPSKLKKRKDEVLREMMKLLDTVTSTSVGQQKLNDAVTMLRLLHIPDDAWVQEKWSLRAQQAYQKSAKTKSKRGDDLSDPAKKKRDNETINQQVQKQIIEIQDSHAGYACFVCAIKFKDPGGRLRLCHHVLHDPAHKSLVKPFLQDEESHKRFPSLMQGFEGYCRLTKKKLSKSEVFGHVHTDTYMLAVANYIPPVKTKKKESHSKPKKRKASSTSSQPSAKRRVKSKEISAALKKEVILEMMFCIREAWCKVGSRLKYWSGVKIKTVLNDLQGEFPELKSWGSSDLERLVNTENRLSVNPDGTKIMFNNHMSRAQYFQEMLVARMYRRFSDDCRTKQEKLEWRGVDTKTLYRDKDVKDAAKDLNLRKEERFKEYIYDNGKSLLGIHHERDTDQKNVKDFTIWVRFEETRRTKNYKKKHLQSELDRIKKKVRPAKQCRASFKKGIEDSMVSKDRITLKDTFTLRRIATPAKAKNCNHTQCFDLESYLKMKLFQRDVYKMKKGSSGERVKVERWKCPVCNKAAKRGDLYVDAFWQEILNDPATKDYDSVFVMPDCTYQVEEMDQGEASDSDEEDEVHSAKKTAKPPQTENAVISLLSDDEDEGPPPAPKLPPKKAAPKPKAVEPPKKSIERQKNSVSKERSRRDRDRSDRRRRSRSPERYRKDVPPTKPASTIPKPAPVEKIKSRVVKMDKPTDYEYLAKILRNINLGSYTDAFSAKKFGLSDLLGSVVRNEMSVVTAVVTDQTDRMMLVQHCFSLMDDPEALLFCIGAKGPLVKAFLGKSSRED